MVRSRTRTAPTCFRSQVARVATCWAMSMKYWSHELLAMEDDLTTPRRRRGLDSAAVALPDQEEDGLLGADIAVPVALTHRGQRLVHLLQLTAAEGAPLVGEGLEHVLRTAAQRPLALLEEVRPEPAEEVGEDAGVVHRPLGVLQAVRADLPDEPPAELARVVSPGHDDALHLRHALLVRALHLPGEPVAHLLVLHPVPHVLHVGLEERGVLLVRDQPNGLRHSAATHP